MIFAGFEVSTKNGVCTVRPDPTLLENIREFPMPQKPKDIKSFQGLIGQVSSFNPDVSQSIATLRLLLKKNCAWRVTKEMKEEFLRAREMFSSSYQESHPFNEDLETGAFFDASKLRGLGWALFQWEKPPRAGIRLIKRGSRSLTHAVISHSGDEAL